RDSSDGKMSSMLHPGKAIYVRISDGLGNQMFQYAAGRALALQNQTELVLEPIPEFFKWLNPSRRFALPYFELSSHVHISYPPLSSRILGKARSLKPDVLTRKECNAYQFQNDIAELKPPARIEGFFQSSNYFKNVPQTILHKEFSLKKELSRRAKELKEKIVRKENSICLHMRLADYKNSEIFFSLRENYYQAALGDILRQLPSRPTVWVFSNGNREEVTALCARSGIPSAEIQTDQRIPEWELLHVMSACQHHVIANSTFSWWAAWLKGNQGITVMPKRWFQEPSWEVSGLRFPGWSQI
ncbi:MAG: alpha-1,2-fucosyltransferase, partial [Pseudomonadota bacterium]